MDTIMFERSRIDELTTLEKALDELSVNLLYIFEDLNRIHNKL